MDPLRCESCGATDADGVLEGWVQWSHCCSEYSHEGQVDSTISVIREVAESNQLVDWPIVDKWLLYALAIKGVGLLERLLGRFGISPNHWICDKGLPWLVARHGNVAMLRLLHRLGADMHVWSQHGSLLDAAVGWSPDPAVVDLLLAWRVGVVMPGGCPNPSALQVAVKGCKVDIVRLFVTHGFDINCANAKGDSALSVAVDWGRHAAAEALIAGGAHVSRQVMLLARQKQHMAFVVKAYERWNDDTARKLWILAVVSMGRAGVDASAGPKSRKVFKR